MDAGMYKQSGGDVERGGMISMRGMALQKRLLPVACVIGLVTTIVLFRYARPEDTILLVALSIAMIVGDVLICASFFRQADEVRDGGDHLIVTRSDQDVRIPLRQVSKVTAGIRGVTLHLAQPVEFGSTITFSPPRALGRGAVVMSLRNRIQAANRPN